MIDVSCFAGPGPLTTVSTLDDLEVLLRGAGVVRALVSPMPALFGSPDFSLPRNDFFTSVPIVTAATGVPAGCRAVRTTEASVALKRACADTGAVLILQVRIADRRNVPASLGLAELTVEEVLAVALAEPAAPMIVAGVRVPELNAILAATPDSVFAELSLAEEPDVVRRAVAAHGAHRLLMGTHAPFLTPLAARSKLDAARLSPAEHAAVSFRNAVALGL